MPPEYTLPQVNTAKPSPDSLESRLEKRVADLEKRTRILMCLCVAACLFAVCSVGIRPTKIAAASQAKDRIVVDEIVATKVVAGAVHVIGADGKSVVVAGNARGSGGYLLAKSDSTKGFTRVDQFGFTAHDDDGTERAKIQANGGNGPGVHLKDEKGVLRAGFTVDGNGAVLEFTDSRADALMNIGVRGKSAVIESRPAPSSTMRGLLGQ